jgi:hypothetical protein
MKKYLGYCAVVLLFLQCEKPIDCVKSSGPVKSKIFEGLTFTKLLVNKRISVIITQGDSYKVEVQAGENLINDIEVTLSGDLLTLSDNTSCNWVRNYGETVVYITAPNITDIYSKTEQNITSNGTLTYPSLHLTLLDDNDGFSGTGTGDFHLQVNNNYVFVECNEVGRFFISGTTLNLNINFAEGGGVFHGENLYANHIGFYHRGSNDLFIRPVLSLIGDIYNVGDVNCYSRLPAENVQVQELYRGRLIYR